ncbi:DUF6261 family protein [Carboxylicivirga taeanensis]|uniref:DUF6261 family protein n=1 Tax=Carboxylicivirga taeanensis TaxID=1416875 RepID=UPI003F6DD4CE
MHKIAFYLFSHKALYTFAKETITIIKSAGMDLTVLSGFIIKAEACFSDFDKALTCHDVNPFTIKINEADSERDQRFLGFKNYVEACSYRKKKSWQEAAASIKLVIDRYGGDIYRMSLPEESAALTNMITDLRQEPHAKACNTIEATVWLDELEADQNQFENLVKQRNNQDTSDSKTLLETRKPLITTLRNLFKMIELQQQVEASDALNALVNHLNNLITSSMASARISKTLSERANVES